MTLRGDYTCVVRFSDVDAFGHVNNVTYYEYYQEARFSLIHSLVEGEDDPILSQVVARLDVDYRRPMLYRAEPYTITSEVTHVGNSSFVVVSRIHDDTEVYSTAESVLVCFDPVTQSSVPLTESQRARLSGGGGPA